MATFVCKINLGLLQQEVYICNKKYSNKDTVESYKMPWSKISEFIANTPDIDKAVLSGPKAYTKKIEKETKEKEIVKYSAIKTEFTYV